MRFYLYASVKKTSALDLYKTMKLNKICVLMVKESAAHYLMHSVNAFSYLLKSNLEIYE